MRIVSQLNMDFPYEQIVVFTDGRNIDCYPVSNMNGRYFRLGRYETEERAEEVFDDIRDTFYAEGKSVFIMPEE